VLMAARAYGYGNIYETVIKTERGTEIPVRVDLLDIPHKEIDETLFAPGVNRFTYTLPKSGHVVEFKLLTSGDQKKIDKELKSTSKFANSSSTSALTTRLSHMILSFNGETDFIKIAKSIQNMLAADSRSLREYVATIQPDLDLEIEEVDPDTGETFRSNFEIGINLFYPDYKK
jgi:hypothetical protein